MLAYDVYKDEEAAKELGFKYVELDELYEKSDIEIDEIYDFRMILPQNSLDFNHADLATDRSDELKKVEGKR